MAPSSTGVRRIEPHAAEHAREVGRRAAGARRGRREAAATRRARRATAPPRPRRRAPSAARTAGRRAPARRSRTPGRRPTAARARARGSRAARATASSPARPARRAADATPVPNASTKNGHVASAPPRVTTSSPSMTAASSSGRDREQRAAREAVGQVPGRQGEERQRDEHRQPDEPEVERVAPHRVDLPADRDERHLDANPVASMTPRKRTKSRCRSGESPRGGVGRSLVYAASPSLSPAGSGVGRNSTSSRWIREPSTSSTVKRRPSVRTSSPGSAARPIRSKT